MRERLAASSDARHGPGRGGEATDRWMREYGASAAGRRGEAGAAKGSAGAEEVEEERRPGGRGDGDGADAGADAASGLRQRGARESVDYVLVD